MYIDNKEWDAMVRMACEVIDIIELPINIPLKNHLDIARKYKALLFMIIQTEDAPLPTPEKANPIFRFCKKYKNKALQLKESFCLLLKE